jgi:hypothetical protein
MVSNLLRTGKNRLIYRQLSHSLFTLVAPTVYPMQLVMYIGNEFIASAAVIQQKISEPGYVSGLKRRLLQEHGEFLQSMTIEPEFFIANLSAPLQSIPTKTCFQSRKQ